MKKGKYFETKVYKELKLAGYFVLRLQDSPPPYSISKPSDYIAYKDGNLIFVECKETLSNTFNFKSNIRNSQFRKLKEILDAHKKIKGGYMINFKAYKTVIWLPFYSLQNLINNNFKSFNFKKMINGKYHKVISQKRAKQYNKFEEE